jgi:cell shape-determining protein MreC
MPRKKKVQDNPDLVKDTTTQAVINTNTSALLNRRAQLSAMKAKDEELEDIKNDIKELKALVKKLGKG